MELGYPVAWLGQFAGKAVLSFHANYLWMKGRSYKDKKGEVVGDN